MMSMSIAMAVLIAFLVVAIVILGLFLWKQQNHMEALKRNFEESQRNPAFQLIQQEIIALRNQTQEALLGVTGQINERLKENVVLLQQSQANVSDRMDRSSKVFGEVQNRLGQLEATNRQILEEIGEMESLKDILKPPKLRGGMGETLLENLLREIFPAEEFYAFQHAFKDGEIVDAVVRFKGGMVPIDAKFPLENFKRMTEAKNEEERGPCRKEFLRNVKKHIDDIHNKYIRPDEGTLDFALMYVPAENIYYEIIVRDSEEDALLLPYALKKKVFPVSPNSFYAFLITLAEWIGVMRFEQKAKQVWGELARLYKDLNRFSEDFEVLGKHLTNAQAKYHEADKRLNRLETKLIAIQEGQPTEALPQEQPLLETTP